MKDMIMNLIDIFIKTSIFLKKYHKTNPQNKTTYKKLSKLNFNSLHHQPIRPHIVS
jgi:hypothetical protein